MSYEMVYSSESTYASNKSTYSDYSEKILVDGKDDFVKLSFILTITG